MTARALLAAAMALAPALMALSCRTSPPDPAVPDPAASEAPVDPAAVRQTYLDLTQKAMAEVRAWSSGDGRNPDPRPIWTKRLEEFAVAHAGASEAADALAGAMQMRAAMLDYEGFVKDFDLMLKTCPDAPAVAGVFPQVSAMRMAEAGGREALETMDDAARRRAWRRAVPGIVGDMQRAIAATSNPSTIAAAEYTMGLSWYQLDVDLPRALEHFKVVAEKYPTWTYATTARDYIRDIETLGPGNPAPDFDAIAVDGRRVALSSLKGRIVLVDFWATWCQPCLRDLPALKRAHDRFQARGFTIVGVSADTDRAALARFAAKERMSWPIIAAGASGSGPADAIIRAYGVQAIPMSYLVDRHGRIRGRALFGTEVERTVYELMGE